MDAVERSRRVREEGTRLLVAAARDLDRPVPTCPGWTQRDLVRHVATVWLSIEAMVSSASPEPLPWSGLPSAPEGDRDLLAHAEGALDRLVEALAEADPATPVWTWSADQVMAFYLRRAHHETLVHRIDAELAAGARTPVDADDAIDAVDELFTVVVAGRDHDLPTGTLHLHQTDGDGEFLLRVDEGAIAVTREHAKGDAALRATAEELLTAMWRRRELDGLELFGDRAVAESWAALAP